MIWVVKSVYSVEESNIRTTTPKYSAVNRTMRKPSVTSKALPEMAMSDLNIRLSVDDFAFDEIAGDNMGAQNYIDLNAVFRFMETHDVIIGVNNVFDKEPPLVGNSLNTNANTIAGYYDTLGRYLFANVTLRW